MCWGDLRRAETDTEADRLCVCDLEEKGKGGGRRLYTLFKLLHVLRTPSDSVWPTVIWFLCSNKAGGVADSEIECVKNPTRSCLLHEQKSILPLATDLFQVWCEEERAVRLTFHARTGKDQDDQNQRKHVPSCHRRPRRGEEENKKSTPGLHREKNSV